MRNHPGRVAAQLLVACLATACGTPQLPTPGAAASARSATEDRGAVEAVVQSHWAAINAGDTATVGRQHISALTIIMAEVGNRFMIPSATADSLFPTLVSFKPQFAVHDLQVQMYGDVGVASFYLTGAVRSDGKPDTRRRTVSEVWVRQPDGTWKEVHHHDSVFAGT